ncbi:MAG: hypothetical protein SPL49_01030 [Oribacterium sp.]|jgi:hypothetical protein|nr:hypothetical protein [Oribacterium sp.]MDY6308593.1 hypothetical protein [Oribacterium sp.]MDY6315796.1 hypothetical protein [Oribacterium sp.]
MLSFLKLRVAGFGAGETGLRIWNSNGTLRYAYDDAPLDGEPSLIVRVPGRIASDFLLKLQDIHVYRWKKSYQPSSKSKKLHLAHSEWNLIYKEDNGQIEEFSGINAYPRKWNQFMELVTNLVQESTAAHLNGLARFDMTLTDMTKGQRADGKEAQITYTETLSLDRYEDTLSYVIRIGEKTQIKHEYKIPEMIDYLLANCEQYLKEHDETGYRLPEHGKPSLSVNVRYRNGRNVSFRRSYNRYGVPDDWNEFLDDFYSAIKYFGLFGSTFDPDLYRHGVKKGEYIFLDCASMQDDATEYFRAKEDDLHVGDVVIVPDTATKKEKMMLVSEIIYCTRDNVPAPLDETNFIIRKYSLSSLFSSDESDEDDDDLDDER